MPTLPARIATACLIATIATTTASAAHLHKEAEYRDAWCRGRTEVTLHDGSRVDCLTENYAVEVEFAAKAFEGLGQAIHYARITGTTPAILMIIEKPEDWKQYRRIRRTARQRHVKLWYITPAQIAQVHVNP